MLAGLSAGLVLLAVPGNPTFMYAGAACVTLTLVVLAMLFAAAETAIVAVRRPRIQQLVEEGSTSARSLQRLLENSAGFVATSRLIITMALVGGNTLVVTVFAPPLIRALGSAAWAYVLLVAFGLFVSLPGRSCLATRFASACAKGTASGIFAAIWSPASPSA